MTPRTLAELHDVYVWQVNAAIGRDRMDLVQQLADEFTDTVLRLMTAAEPPGCGRPGCAICAGLVVPTPPARWPRRRWWFRGHSSLK